MLQILMLVLVLVTGGKLNNNMVSKFEPSPHTGSFKVREIVFFRINL